MIEARWKHLFFIAFWPPTKMFIKNPVKPINYFHQNIFHLYTCKRIPFKSHKNILCYQINVIVSTPGAACEADNVLVGELSVMTNVDI